MTSNKIFFKNLIFLSIYLKQKFMSYFFSSASSKLFIFTKPLGFFLHHLCMYEIQINIKYKSIKFNYYYFFYKLVVIQTVMKNITKIILNFAITFYNHIIFVKWINVHITQPKHMNT